MLALGGGVGYDSTVHDKAGVKCAESVLPAFPTIASTSGVEVFAMTITDDHVIYVCLLYTSDAADE